MMKSSLCALALLTACAADTDLDLDTDADTVSAELGLRHDPQNPNPGIAPPNSRPFGLSYGQWAKQWWRWVHRTPASIHPVIDLTGELCDVNQIGPVWFLAGTFNAHAERECTIPYGKSLFFPIFNSPWIQIIGDPDLTPDEMRALVKEGFFDGVVVSATIDGVPVKQLESYYEESPVFQAILPIEDNYLGLTEDHCPLGPFGQRLVCDPFLDIGYYLFLKPLSRGDHTIRFTAKLESVGFDLDVSYLLHIE